MRARAALTAVVLLGVGAARAALAPPGPPPDRWAAWRFLVGDWVGEGGGDPGRGSGWFSFGFDLDANVLVRRNHSEYPGAQGAPAVHDDLMIIYPEGGPGGFAAVYFDNEGHVIHYTATVASDGSTVTFLSIPQPSAPGYRLTYRKLPGGALGITFDVASPNGPGIFKTYLSGRAFPRNGR